MKTFKIILLLLLIVLSTWIYSRWDVWFGKRSEPYYRTPNAVHHVQLTFGENGINERIVSWRTAENDTTLRLRYTNDVDRDTIISRPYIKDFSILDKETHDTLVKAFYYRVTIPTLQIANYSYAIGNGEWYNFSVKPTHEFRALCLGDIQNNESNDSSLFDSIVKFTRPNFIIQVGDLVERPFMKYWDVYFSDFKNIAPRIPMLAVLGNHDYHKFPNKYPDPRFFFGFPYFYDTAATVDEKERQSACYTLQYGDVNFHLFDTNRFFLQLKKQANMFEDKRLNPNDIHVALMHHPPYSMKSKLNNIDVRLAFASLFQKNGVDLVLAGHEHMTKYRFPSTDDDVPFAQAISHFSHKSYAKPKVYDRTFAVLEYKNDTLFYHIYDDKFNLIKDYNVEMLPKQK